MKCLHMALVGLLIFSISATELALPLRNALAQLSEKSSTFDWGRTFHTLLELTLNQDSSKSKTDEVIEKVKKLRDQIANDLQQEQAEYVTASVQYESTISTLEETVETQSNELRVINIQIGDLGEELANLLSTSASQKKQLSLLSGREEDLRAGRNDDEGSFNKRTRDSNRIVDALTHIVNLLAEAVFQQQGQSFVEISEGEKKQMVNTLKAQLGNDHPLSQLVSLTTKFDIPTVTRIIEKLEGLRNSILLAAQSDQQIEDEAVVRFQTAIQQLTSVQTQLSKDAQNILATMQRKWGEKTVAEKSRDQLVIDVPLTQSALTNNRNGLDILTATFQQRKQSRTKELAIVNEALELITAASNQVHQ